MEDRLIEQLTSQINALEAENAAMRGGGASKCPFATQHTQNAAKQGAGDWWPNSLNLKPLGVSNPEEELGSYAEAFATLDLEAVKQDVFKMLTRKAGLTANGHLQQQQCIELSPSWCVRPLSRTQREAAVCL